MRSPCHRCKHTEVERQEASTEGRQTLTGPSTAALTASFTGTLIGPLMAVEKGGEGDENGICPSFLAFIISLFAPCLFMSHKLFPSLAVLLEKTLFCC